MAFDTPADFWEAQRKELTAIQRSNHMREMATQIFSALIATQSGQNTKADDVAEIAVDYADMLLRELEKFDVLNKDKEQREASRRIEEENERASIGNGEAR